MGKYVVCKGQSAEKLADQLNLTNKEVGGFEVIYVTFDERIRVWVAIIMVWEDNSKLNKEETNNV